MKALLFFIILVFPVALSAQSYTCPDKATLDRFIGFGDLFFGEMHGTTETSRFIRCLVEHALATSPERVIVSLEMPDTARDPFSLFWQLEQMEDGRSSRAMFELVKYLVGQENQARLNLHFQHHSRYFDSPDLINAYQANRAKAIGLELRSLSERGLVIALAGNIHSLKFVPASFGINMDTEGMFTGPGFTHINISSAHGGTFWACIAECGIQSMQVRENPGAVPGTLVDGTGSGHDYIYYLDIDQFTASEPMNIFETR